MRNTLPLSSFPLQLLLAFEQFYHLFLSLVIFFLVLYKTYNLPYTGGMSVQEGILLLLFFGFMQARIRFGLSANRVHPFPCRLRAPITWLFSSYSLSSD